MSVIGIYTCADLDANNPCVKLNFVNHSAKSNQAELVVTTFRKSLPLAVMPVDLSYANLIDHVYIQNDNELSSYYIFIHLHQC